MRPSQWREILYHVCRWCSWLFIFLTALCGLFGVWLEPDPAGWPKLLKFHRLLQANADWLVTFLPVGAGGFALIAANLGEPWYWNSIQKLLDQFQRDVFDKAYGDDFAADHRVTLYRFGKRCWWPGNRWRFWWPWGRGNRPWSGWLIPILRAGERSTGRTVFLAKGSGAFEGVAGAAFFSQRGVVELKDLPDVHGNVAPDVRADYARTTFVPVQWLQSRLERRRPCAKSFLAIRIEVNNRPWGVIMIDSRAEKIPAPQVTLHKFLSMRSALEVLLERA
ncbi:MAG: hypothetical protein KY476_01905 [Planctomycetes bacterium]|nr:hypothetical protein [Planctomycetota bacterium]